MLTVRIPSQELFNNRTSQFIQIREQELRLEHSLVSVSKWEAKWKKPFLSNNNKSMLEMQDYVRCMTITQNVDPNTYLGIPTAVMKQIWDYIEDSMTATWFKDLPNTPQGRKKLQSSAVTSELIYYWMTVHNIPFECEKWHLNRLFTLIRVCNEKNKDQPKMSKSDRRALMEQRRAASKARKH